jgi:hypothetical protein
MPGASVALITKAWKALAAVAVLVFAVAFWITAFNDVRPLTGLVPTQWYCWDNGDPRPHPYDSVLASDHPCSYDELPESFRRSHRILDPASGDEATRNWVAPTPIASKGWYTAD